MIHIVTPSNSYHYRDEMERAFRLRHQVFVEEMGLTELAKPDGREFDQFDNEHAVHILYIEQGKVLGYQRMLPSTRPHLLSEVTPELCEGERPVAPHIWEGSRHCVAPGLRKRRRLIALTLLSGMVEWGVENGISTVIVEDAPFSLLYFIRLHFRPLPLGMPRRIGNRDIVAFTVTFDWRTLNRLREISRKIQLGGQRL